VGNGRYRRSRGATVDALFLGGVLTPVGVAASSRAGALSPVGEHKRDRRVRWPQRLPSFNLTRVLVREVRIADAPALAATMADPGLQPHVTGPVLTQEAVARFIKWARQERRHERLICFAIVPHDSGKAAGVFQMWPVGRDCGALEIGSALEPRLWGTGAFTECARAAIDFAIDSMGIHRIEARASVTNTRAQRALAKLGAVREGVMRQCFWSEGRLTDYEMWSIVASEWRHPRDIGDVTPAP
jgi:RimJ/RimL family protein N-acetyltransferase